MTDTIKTPTDAAMTPCGECGMPCAPGEYHPYAACLMFRACRNSEVVRSNLEAVRGSAPTGEPVAWQGVNDPTDLYYRKPPQADVHPLYRAAPTQPAEPPRVPLPEKQIWDIVNQQVSDMLDGKQEQLSPITIGRAIEAAHGIKHKEGGAP